MFRGGTHAGITLLQTWWTAGPLHSARPPRRVTTIRQYRDAFPIRDNPGISVYICCNECFRTPLGKLYAFFTKSVYCSMLPFVHNVIVKVLFLTGGARKCFLINLFAAFLAATTCFVSARCMVNKNH